LALIPKSFFGFGEGGRAAPRPVLGSGSGEGGGFSLNPKSLFGSGEGVRASLRPKSLFGLGEEETVDTVETQILFNFILMHFRI
jgi:hypothetical protein